MNSKTGSEAALFPSRVRSHEGLTGDADSPLRQGHRIAFHAIIFLTAFLIVFSRRPDAVLHAQFFAEDGKVWYHDAYQFELYSLLLPYAGYLHTLTRLIALLTLFFPFSLAPLVVNLCAMTVQILPVNVFLSSRFSNLGIAARSLAGFLYLALPNSHEIDANISNIQWHLGLLACLLLLARPASTRGWRFFDGIVLVLISLNGVMGIVLVPLAVILWWRRRNLWPGMPFVPLVPGAVIQAFTVLLSRSRPRGPDGASFARFISIVGRQVFLGSLVGKRTLDELVIRYSAGALFLVEVIAIAVGLGLLLYALRYGPTELRLFILFAAAVFALCLMRPLLAPPDQLQWDFLIRPGDGNRYFFLPMLAFLASLFWMVADTAVPRNALSCGVAAPAVARRNPSGLALSSFRGFSFSGICCPVRARAVGN